VSRTYEALQACLLCDFEVLFKARLDDKPERQITAFLQDMLSGGVRDAIQFHSEAGNVEGQLEDDSLAWIVNASRSIALGPGGSSAEAHIPALNDSDTLESIFNHLNQADDHARFAAKWFESGIQYPSETSQNGSGDYREVWEQWTTTIKRRLFEPPFANALLESLERCFSYIPAPGYDDRRRDVSMFHHSKAIAAIGCCLERWLCSRGISNYREVLRSNSDALMKSEPFVLFSMDMSGIQSFIYTISNKGALKGLRVRSFYLSMLIEHISDMILEACQLTRANLIYSGGGRAHLLLPNTEASLNEAKRVVRISNDFLREQFDTSLFLACGCVTASVEQLSSTGDESFSDIFRAASREISQQKLQRYSADELVELNRREKQRPTDRECVICGKSGHLVSHGENEMVCETCDRLERFSNTLTEDNLSLVVSSRKGANAIPLPGGMWLSRADSEISPDDVIRTYCINSDYAPLPNCVWLYTGNFRACDDDGFAMTFEQLAAASSGVGRLGVLRADVDNLGMLFATGLLAPKESKPHRYATLPRYMALSAAMTAFFQREINHIVGQVTPPWIPGAKAPDRRHVTIVYSGGDDVFLVGAWNEVLDAGLSLQRAFSRYTGGRVTLSAGLGLFTPHEPVGIMADITADLEEEAKLIGDGTKNAIALFAPASGSQNAVSFDFHWEFLRQNIIDDKLPTLYHVFKDASDEEQEAGNAFLYQALELLRDIGRNPIAIARLAYLLARHAPPEKRNPNEREKERKANYDAFSKSVYQWALDTQENRALQAAILLHVYSHRRERENDV